MNQKILIVIIAAIVIFFGYLLINGFSKKENESLDLDNIKKEMGLSDNKINKNMEPQNQTASDQEEQIKKEILKQGIGAAAKNGDKITVHYSGFLLDGTKFDSSVDRGTPFTFTLGEGKVIQGWELGLVGSKVGEKMRLTIPSQFGYGEAGTPGGPIPPNAALIFEVEILAINE